MLSTKINRFDGTLLSILSTKRARNGLLSLILTLLVTPAFAETSPEGSKPALRCTIALNPSGNSASEQQFQTWLQQQTEIKQQSAQEKLGPAGAKKLVAQSIIQAKSRAQQMPDANNLIAQIKKENAIPKKSKVSFLSRISPNLFPADFEPDLPGSHELFRNSNILLTHFRDYLEFQMVDRAELQKNMNLEAHFGRQLTSYQTYLMQTLQQRLDGLDSKQREQLVQGAIKVLQANEGNRSKLRKFVRALADIGLASNELMFELLRVEKELVHLFYLGTEDQQQADDIKQTMQAFDHQLPRLANRIYPSQELVNYLLANQADFPIWPYLLVGTNVILPYDSTINEALLKTFTEYAAIYPKFRHVDALDFGNFLKMARYFVRFRLYPSEVRTALQSLLNCESVSFDAITMRQLIDTIPE